MYKLSTAYKESELVCVLREISINMCPTRDRNKNKSAISVRSE